MSRVVTALLLIFALAAQAEDVADENSRQWKFRVLLDGSEIGYHSYRLQDEGDSRVLYSEAQFKVKFLFFTAYRYQHSDTEEWNNGCISDLQAETTTNGKTQHVSGERTDDAFVVETNGSRRQLPECVMTFAYWDPRILQQSKLLNPQTGEYLPVEVEKLPVETLTVRGMQIRAFPYRVSAKGIELRLWYSEDDHWLALESDMKGSRTLRYELI